MRCTNQKKSDEEIFSPSPPSKRISAIRHTRYGRKNGGDVRTTTLGRRRSIRSVAAPHVACYYLKFRKDLSWVSAHREPPKNTMVDKTTAVSASLDVDTSCERLAESNRSLIGSCHQGNFAKFTLCKILRTAKLNEGWMSHANFFIDTFCECRTVCQAT